MTAEIYEIEPNPNQTAIKMLEDMLEQAKAGHIQALAIAGCYADGSCFNAFVAEWQPVHLIGELRLLERDIVDLYCDTRRKPAWEYCE